MVFVYRNAGKKQSDDAPPEQVICKKKVCVGREREKERERKREIMKEVLLCVRVSKRRGVLTRMYVLVCA